MSLIALPLLGQEVLKTFAISSQYTSLPGTPRVVRNEESSSWLVVWRQQSRILGRTVRQDGLLGSIRVLETGIPLVQSAFDLAYDSTRNRYALVSETRQGLQISFYNPSLQRLGPSRQITNSAESTSPRLVYQFDLQKFVVLWLDSGPGGTQTSLNRAIVDPSGAVVIESVVTQAPSQKGFWGLNVTQNPKSGDVFALVSIQALNQSFINGSVAGYVLTPAGELKKATPVVFQPASVNLRSSANLAFDKSGAGFGVWSFGSSRAI